MVSKEFVLNQIDRHGSKFYKVFNDTKNLLDECYKGEHTPSELKEKLSLALENVNCIATVILTDRNDLNKGGSAQKLEYKVDARSEKSSPIAATQMAVSSSQSYLKEYLDSREELSLLKVQLAHKENEIANLKKELKEALEEPEEIGAVNSSEMELLKYLGNLFTPQATGIAGTDTQPENKNPMTPEERNDRVKAALNKWAKADKDFVMVLEAVANLATSNPSKYNMAKSMI